MAYAHIDNLYKDQRILAFRRCYALEKVHGTSAAVHWKDNEVRFFSGGEAHDRFVGIFDPGALYDAFIALGHPAVSVFGEAYGGKQQGMSKTYGSDLRFIVFDVCIGDLWTTVPTAEGIAISLGLEFVPYEEGPTDLDWLDAQRDRPSVVAVRCGMPSDLPREGIVIRPPFEVVANDGRRICAKHKGAAFAERRHPPEVVDPSKLQVLTEAAAVADEWVTPMRLAHVIDKLRLGAPDMSQTRNVITAMTDDVLREAAGEIVDSREVRGAIGKATATLFKARVQAAFRE